MSLQDLLKKTDEFKATSKELLSMEAELNSVAKSANAASSVIDLIRFDKDISDKVARNEYLAIELKRLLRVSPGPVNGTCLLRTPYMVDSSSPEDVVIKTPSEPSSTLLYFTDVDKIINLEDTTGNHISIIEGKKDKAYLSIYNGDSWCDFIELDICPDQDITLVNSKGFVSKNGTNILSHVDIGSSQSKDYPLSEMGSISASILSGRRVYAGDDICHAYLKESSLEVSSMTLSDKTFVDAFYPILPTNEGVVGIGVVNTSKDEMYTQGAHLVVINKSGAMARKITKKRQGAGSFCSDANNFFYVSSGINVNTGNEEERDVLLLSLPQTYKDTPSPSFNPLVIQPTSFNSSSISSIANVDGVITATTDTGVIKLGREVNGLSVDTDNDLSVDEITGTLNGIAIGFEETAVKVLTANSCITIPGFTDKSLTKCFRVSGKYAIGLTDSGMVAFDVKEDALDSSKYCLTKNRYSIGRKHASDICLIGKDVLAICSEQNGTIEFCRVKRGRHRPLIYTLKQVTGDFVGNINSLENKCYVTTKQGKVLCYSVEENEPKSGVLTLSKV